MPGIRRFLFNNPWFYDILFWINDLFEINALLFEYDQPLLGAYLIECLREKLHNKQ